MRQRTYMMQSVLLLLFLPSAAAGQDAASGAREYMDAPVWYLHYDVSFTATRDDTRKLEVTTQLGPQTLTTDMSMDLRFSNSVALDNRMDGPVLSTADQELEISPGMTQAQQLAAMEKMMSSMDHTANWTEKPPEMGDDLAAAMQQRMEESAVPAYLEYHRVAVQGGLLNEFNRHYDMTTFTTWKGEGMVSPSAGTIFEVDAAAGEYLLTLPFGFQDMNTEMDTVKVEEVTQTAEPGDTPLETGRMNSGRSLEPPDDFGLLDPKLQMDDMALIHGKLQPGAGKISGERSFQAHFTDQGETDTGTLTFRYTLATTPPPKG
jgi:hypothetical protein